MSTQNAIMVIWNTSTSAKTLGRRNAATSKIYGTRKFVQFAPFWKLLTAVIAKHVKDSVVRQGC